MDVGQIVDLAGLEYCRVAAILREKTSVLAKSRQLATYIVAIPQVHGTVVVPLSIYFLFFKEITYLGAHLRPKSASRAGRS